MSALALSYFIMTHEEQNITLNRSMVLLITYYTHVSHWIMLLMIRDLDNRDRYSIRDTVLMVCVAINVYVFVRPW